jgi:hypothetical protein
MPRRFYLKLRTSDLSALSVPPHIVSAVARKLKVTLHAPVSVPLRHDELCEYTVQREWFNVALYFVRG